MLWHTKDAQGIILTHEPHCEENKLCKLNRLKIFGIVVFYFLCFQINAKEENKYKLAVCALFQNEDFFLKEWLEFHLLMGVEHFYLYDNLSTDRSLDILQPYIDAGFVDLFSWPVETCNQSEYLKNLQLPIYNHALQLAKEKAQWIAFIDLDEFLFPVIHSDLISFLDEYQTVAGLAVNWQMYGSSYIEKLLPNQLITENLTLKAQASLGCNQLIKMIVQPKYVNAINNPHYFDFHSGYYATDSSGRELPAGAMGQPVNVDHIRINHYWCGSKEWLHTQKVARREKWGLPPNLLETIDKTYNQVEDLSIYRFLPRLKAAIANSLAV